MPWFRQGALLLICTVPVVVLFGYATGYVVLRAMRPSSSGSAAWSSRLLPIVGPLVYLVVRPPGTTAGAGVGVHHL